MQYDRKRHGICHYSLGETALRSYIGADIGVYFTQYVYVVMQDKDTCPYYNTPSFQSPYYSPDIFHL